MQRATWATKIAILLVLLVWLTSRSVRPRWKVSSVFGRRIKIPFLKLQTAKLIIIARQRSVSRYVSCLRSRVSDEIKLQPLYYCFSLLDKFVARKVQYEFFILHLFDMFWTFRSSRLNSFIAFYASSNKVQSKVILLNYYSCIDPYHNWNAEITKP